MPFCFRTYKRQKKQPPDTHRSLEEPLQLPEINVSASISPSSAVPARSISEDDDVWVKAEKLLRDNDATKKIMETATEILQANGCQFDDKDPQKQLKISSFLSEKSQAVESQIASREIFHKISQNILSYKDVITTTASASPPAAIACAGFMVVLQERAIAMSTRFFIKVAQGKGILLQGLERTSGLIPRIIQVQKTYLDTQVQLADGFMPQFTKNLTELCRKVLEFHARALCYLSKRKASQWAKDILNSDSWNSVIQGLESSEREVMKFISLVEPEMSKSRDQNLQEQIQQNNILKSHTEKEKKRSALLEILYTCPYRDRKNRNRERVPGTCEWFTSQDRFKKDWDEQSQFPLLWVSADPGCGKSVLSKYLVDEILPEKNRKLCYFFFKDDLSHQNTAIDALACLLHQVISALPSLPELAEKKFKDHREKLVTSFQDLWDIFESIMSDPNTGEVVFVIDALDECRDGDQRQFIQAISKYCSKQRQQPHRVKFLMTSRPYNSIRIELLNLERQFPKIHLSGDSEDIQEKISHEIGLVVKSLIEEISREKDLTPSEIDFLIQKMNPKSDLRNRTYLWATLTLDFIKNIPGFNRGEVEDSLQSLPASVNQAYEKILSQTKNPEQATLLLHIVLAAKRPLSLEELSLCYALKKVYHSDDEVLKYKDSAENFKIKVREFCGLLLSISDGKVYLLHQTLKEFLVPKDSLEDTTIDPTVSAISHWQASFETYESHGVLGRRCAWFLLSDLTDSTFQAFREYASKNWNHHIRFLYPCKEKDTDVVELCLQLCSSGSTKFYEWSCYRGPGFDGFRNKATSLSIASYLGIGILVQKLLLHSSLDLDSLDSKMERSPLSWASYKGYSEVVKLLLDTGKVDADSKDIWKQTPLYWASCRGHLEVVKLLLGTGKVDADSKDIDQQTPLSLASRHGHSEVVKLLLGTGKVDVDSKDIDQQTPLTWASYNGHSEVVKLLLGTEKVDADLKDLWHQTPLYWALLNGHLEVVKLLLGTGKVDVDSKDGYMYQQTPLSLASRHGHSEVVKFLLGTGKVDVDSKDVCQRTPLSWASYNGHSEVVQLLLDSGAKLADLSNHPGDLGDETVVFLPRGYYLKV